MKRYFYVDLNAQRPPVDRAEPWLTVDGGEVVAWTVPPVSRAEAQRTFARRESDRLRLLLLEARTRRAAAPAAPRPPARRTGIPDLSSLRWRLAEAEAKRPKN